MTGGRARWRRHRWELRAAARDDEHRYLARAFNDDPQRFVLRASARSTARFFEKVLRLPLNFYVVRAGTVTGDPAGQGEE